MLAAPTAAGKTATVLALADRWPIEVVSADAMQVYRGLTIGTAAPGAAERARVPHHLVGLVDPTTPYSVALYVPAAEAAIAEVLARGRVPLVVGGTGFYLDALIHGLPTTPKADRRVQAEIAAELGARGIDALLEELAAASSEDAERAQRNPRRVVRALEVLRRTGRPPAAFPPKPPRFAYRAAVVLPSPETLQARVRARTRAMIDEGWLDEVRALAPTMDRWATARQAIGYEALRRVLAGTLRLDDAVAGIEQATLRYAKRQRTWFRQRPPRALRLEGPVESHRSALATWLASSAEG
jgi:tRNA dimethylallyltransferase